MEGREEQGGAAVRERQPLGQIHAQRVLFTCPTYGENEIVVRAPCVLCEGMSVWTHGDAREAIETVPHALFPNTRMASLSRCSARFALALP